MRLPALHALLPLAALGSLCDDLRSQVAADRVLCAEAGDDISQKYNFDSFNPRCAELVPDYVVTVQNSEDVKRAVSLARQNGRAFSVRGGGHSYVCNGFKRGSVHLDMRQWAGQIDYQEDGGDAFVTLRPGHLLRDLQEQLPSTHEYAMGTCPSVGAFGFYLHGGSSPRTSFLGNETIYSMTVVTADGEERSIDHDSKHEEEKLWDAMRQAGSSFGVVTSLTLKLKDNAERTSFLVPVKGLWSELISVVLDEEFIKRSKDLGIWVGLFRWDTFSGPLWYLKVAMQLTESPCKLEELTREDGCKHVPYSQRAASNRGHLGKFFNVHLSKPVADEPAQALANLMANYNLEFNTLVADLLPDTQSAELPPVLPPGEPVPWPKHGDSGSVGRFVSMKLARDQAERLHDFFHHHVLDCWFDLGPVKGDLKDDLFLDLSCFEHSALDALRDYEANTPELHEARRYYNLPLWSSEQRVRDEYFPHYDELSDIKAIWDPEDFFNIPDGIHPPGAAWPSYDPFGASAADVII